MVTRIIDEPTEGSGAIGASLDTLTTDETSDAASIGGADASGGSRRTADTLPWMRASEKTMRVSPSVNGVVGSCAQLTFAFVTALDVHAVCRSCAAEMAVAVASKAAFAAVSSSHALWTCSAD